MKYTYEKYYKSHRPDGRIVASQAAFMERLRRERPLYSVPKNATKEELIEWQKNVRAKASELLHMPPFTEQPAPVLLSSVQHDGYRAETWEFYPDDISAVPVIMLVPDSATAASPAPAVFCFAGSFGNKEFLADEPLIEGKAGFVDRYPDRNRMGRYYAENGMVAVCFDHISMGALALDTDDEGRGWHNRTYLTHLLLAEGYSYTGLSAQHAFCFLHYVKTLPFVDAKRLAVSGHSLGTETAIYMAMVSDDISAVVFNDMCASHRDRMTALTEYESLTDPLSLCLNIHLVPGTAHYFDLKDLCAAVAPRPIAMNEGGPDEYLEEIRSVYAAFGAEENLQITHYPKYEDPETRKYHGKIPLAGLSVDTHFDWSYTNPSDHSFRKEPSIRFLRRVFFGE